MTDWTYASAWHSMDAWNRMLDTILRGMPLGHLLCLESFVVIA